MTSEPDEYEALAYQVHEAGRQDWPKPWDQRPAAAILREWGEAKLAEVRAQRDDALALGDRQLDLGKQMLEALADRDRTIAEQAAVIERLREALSKIERMSGSHDAFGSVARTALQETADGK